MKKEIFLVPYAHLDSQWRWEYPTTINKYIKNTIEENLEMFNRYDEHQFNFTGAIRYEFMKDYYPEQYKQVKERIKQNKWHLAGTCLDETDALIPSMESMTRNILYGTKWQQAEFGKTSKDYMIPDCFGFPKNMPTVLAHNAINGFSTQKLTWGSAVGIPFELGVWKGSDNSAIISALNPGSYGSRLFPSLKYNCRKQKQLYDLGKTNDVWKSFQYYGVGDIGGAPTEGSIKRAIKSINHFGENHSKFTVRQGSTTQFFDTITTEEKSKLDTYTGDLLLTNHSAGTLTSAAIMKRWNRKNEQLAYAAETAAVMAKEIAGLPYPMKKIQQAWKRFIACQMHDILPGTSTPLAYEYSHNDEVIALNTWTSILQDSAQAIAPYVEGNGDILVFNPLAELRSDVIRFTYPRTITHIKDNSGNVYPVTYKEGAYHVAATLAPMSYTRFEGFCKTTPSNQLLQQTDDNYILENKFIKVSINNEGTIFSIVNKENNKELLKEPIAYEFQKERPWVFPAWNMDWRDRKKKASLRLEKGEVSIVVNDANMATIRITTTHNLSVFHKDVSIVHNSNLISFKETIHWFEKGVSLKLAFSPNMTNPTTTYNWESDRVKRGINHEKMFEVPSRLWMNINESDFGFSILENSKYGYDRPTVDKVRMTLLFTPAIWYINGFWDQRYHDFGEHTIQYAIHPNNGTYHQTDTLARQFNSPARTYLVESSVNEKSQKIASFITIESNQVGVSALKQAEDSNDIIIRLYDRLGVDTTTKITSSKNIVSCIEVNGLEEPIRTIKVEHNKAQVTVPKYGLKAFKISFKSEIKIKETYETVVLPYDMKMFSSNKLKDALYPLELLPETVLSGDGVFALSKDSFNAVASNGQEIVIPTGYRRISLLVGANKEEETSFVTIGNEKTEHKVTISSMTAFVGQWDKRLWKKPIRHHLNYGRDYVWKNPYVGLQDGFVNRNRLELYTRHTHKDGIDQAYQFGYMFRVDIPIQPDVQTLILPKNKNVRIFSGFVSENTIIHDATHLIDKYDF